MVEKLKRITSEADHHKVLDISFLCAFFIGLQQLIACVNAIYANIGGPFIWVLAFQMFALSICGAFAYVWHIQGKVYAELSVIPLIVTGYATILVSTAMVFIMTPPKDPFFVNAGGFSIGLIAFLCIEMGERIYKIQVRRRQIRISQKEMRITEQRSPEKIKEKVEEIRRAKGL